MSASNVIPKEDIEKKVVENLEKEGIPDEDILQIFVFGSFIYQTNLLKKAKYLNIIHQNSTAASADYDLIVVIANNERYKSKFLDNSGRFSIVNKEQNVDLLVYTEDTFAADYLQENQIHCYEIASYERNPLLHNFIIRQRKPLIVPTSIDHEKMRKAISFLSNEAYHKGRQKIVKENEYYLGLKKLVHSFRIVMFGIQILENDGFIHDFTCANELYSQAMNDFDKCFEGTTSTESTTSTSSSSESQAETLARIMKSANLETAEQLGNWIWENHFKKPYKALFNQVHSKFKKLAPKSIPPRKPPGSASKKTTVVE